MTEQQFNTEMMKAKTFKDLETDRAEYWAGYMRGLRRAYHGDKFGTAEEHKAWYGAADDQDPCRQQRGQGYRDGLKGCATMQN